MDADKTGTKKERTTGKSTIELGTRNPKNLSISQYQETKETFFHSLFGKITCFFITCATFKAHQI